jgi:DNA-binding response OmpR family regulator
MSILLIEDDLALSDIVAFALRRAGFNVVTAYDGEQGIAMWTSLQPKLALVDLNLPRRDGLSVCRHIRDHGDTPIIVLSVRNSDEEIVRALESGADDYLVKPFSPAQLVARIRAVLRRSANTAAPSRIETGGLALDRERRLLHIVEMAPIQLTALECRLLDALMLNAGQVLTSDTLIRTVWGSEGGNRSMLKQLVYRVRAKLGDQRLHHARLEAVPGVGYALTVEERR